MGARCAPLVLERKECGLVQFAGATSGSAGAKAREALWAAICFNMSVADWRGVSQIISMLIACPQSLHVMRVPPAMLLVVVYMPQAYSLLAASAEDIGTAPKEGHH